MSLWLSRHTCLQLRRYPDACLRGVKQTSEGGAGLSAGVCNQGYSSGAYSILTKGQSVKWYAVKSDRPKTIREGWEYLKEC